NKPARLWHGKGSWAEQRQVAIMGRKQHKRVRLTLIFNDRPHKRELTASIPTAVQSVCKVI
ncbi:MAG: hypothetical protein QE265_05695, partial [Rhodoferax sp.]|nr:hypothetical protein [Rhodoferax sp.]